MSILYWGRCAILEEKQISKSSEVETDLFWCTMDSLVSYHFRWITHPLHKQPT